MLLGFYLSGIHETLPVSEVRACLEVLAKSYEIVCSMPQLLLVEIDGIELEKVQHRLSMTHEIFEIMVAADSFDGLLEKALEIDFDKAKTFRVRTSQIGGKVFSDRKIVDLLGGGLHEKGLKVDLMNPQMPLKVLISGELWVLGLMISSEVKGFEERKPHLKPFFKPGVILPRFARVFVNLVRLDRGELLFDPFCGTGSILVEAGLCHICNIGGDIDPIMVRGYLENMQYYGLQGAGFRGWVQHMPIKDCSIDGIVTDTPYGKSSSTYSQSLERLLTPFFREIHRVLKPAGYAVVVTNREVEKLFQEIGFSLVEMHHHQVHRSMCRHIYLLRKDMENRPGIY